MSTRIDAAEVPTRRTLLKAAGASAALMTLGAEVASAQSGPVAPPSTVTPPPRDFSPSGAPTTYFTDPDVLTVDPRFNGLRAAERADPAAVDRRALVGRAGVELAGRYLVWSDIPNNRQLRWLEDDGHVSVFRTPSNNSNGNTFDFQGRQLSCEHLTRRVVRYELDGSATILRRHVQRQTAQLAERCRCRTRTAATGSPIRPTAGSSTKARRTRRAGPTNTAAGSTQRLGQPPEIGSYKRELPTNCYRIDPSGRVDLVVAEDQVPDPNGLCFSPDYKKLYVVSTGKGPGDTGPGGKGDMYVFDVGVDNKLSNQKLFTRLHGGRREVRTGRRALPTSTATCGAPATPAAPWATAG